MIVEIKKNKEKYSAEPYCLDPSEKVTLLRKIGKNGKEIGKQVMRNEYRSDVNVLSN